ncbi:GRIP and coiled-coil domain-containing protein-like isoform X2 [Centruroides vittatus]|uniref:GRIP and coiled-coil domain-containing protein-like isoform X2 n=1 Tax=Centruroides vittatus TaxID=120091 RepID=UPI00350EC4B7
MPILINTRLKMNDDNNKVTSGSLSETEATSEDESLVEQQDLQETDNLKSEKNDSSSDIELIDYAESLQSSISSHWSVFNSPDISNVEVKEEVERKNVGIQTDQIDPRFVTVEPEHQTESTISQKHYLLFGLLILIIAFIFNMNNTKENTPEIALLQDLSIMLKELSRDVKCQMRGLQKSDVLFNKILNRNENFTSLMRDITEMKVQVQRLNEDISVLNYSLMEENLKDLQDRNENLTNEVRKLRELFKDGLNYCIDSQEMFLYLNHSIYNNIQERINRKHCTLLKQLNLNEEECKSLNGRAESKVDINLKKESKFKNWVFDRANARSKKRDVNNPQDWQSNRALGRDLLRNITIFLFVTLILMMVQGLLFLSYYYFKSEQTTEPNESSLNPPVSIRTVTVYIRRT